jgi:hypothetical protein
MLGAAAMERLAERSLLAEPPRIFATHKGLGLLLRKDRAGDISSLADFAASENRLVIATPNEAGARLQYLATLDELIGEEAVARLIAREVADFPGRLGIQHRDVPFALLNDLADGGIIFGHLARFYAERWPEDLVFVEVPQAAAFGEEITVAQTMREGGERALSEAFLEFLFLEAPEAYEAGGFAAAETFGFGEPVQR